MRGHPTPRPVVPSQERGCLEVGEGCLEVGEGYRESGSTARVEVPRERTSHARAGTSCRGVIV